jgi:hypothetical protein
MALLNGSRDVGIPYRKRWLGFYLGCWLLGFSLSPVGCTSSRAPRASGQGFSDNFDRTELGSAWNNTGGPYQLRDGMLHVQGARNRPLWLRRALPDNVRVEFDVRSDSADGDIKVELFGDGVSRAESLSYTATGYVVIFGGWGNRLNVLARLNEHGDDRVVGPVHPVVRGHRYRIKIERRRETLTAWADGHRLGQMVDSDPLRGQGHNHFAFNNWKSELWFDNLKITPL